MKSPFQKNPHFDRLSVTKYNFIFKNTAIPGMAEDDDEAAAQLEQMQQMQGQQRSRDEMQAGVTRAQVTPETRQLMREYLASENFEQQSLVERFLNGEIKSEKEFKEEREALEQHTASWQAIFDVQRGVRKKIQALQYKTESYVELLPNRKARFEGLTKSLHGLNGTDYRNDRSLTEIFTKLTKGDAATGKKPVLQKEEARELYEVDPNSSGFADTVKKYKSAIEAAPEGKAMLRRYLALKKEEARIQKEFNRLDRDATKIIQDILSKVRIMAEEKQVLKQASKAIGITLKEGTEIAFSEADILAFDERTLRAKISRIEIEKIPIFDHNGKVIDHKLGVPMITLSNGAVKAKMPLGRFKKWADAVDAVEEVAGLKDAEEKTGLAAYGIQLKKGLSLTYARRERNPKTGAIAVLPQYTNITEIKDGRIYFSEPVLFNPGWGVLAEDDMRDNLTFGEFVKWWHRYDVEKEVGQEELQELLLQYNDIENKEFGLEPKENPPILLKAGEELRYPDEGGESFRIEAIGPGNISLEGGQTFSFPQFFNWVKNNHVQKVPEREKGKEEKAEDEKRRREVEAMKADQEALESMKEHAGKKREHAVAEDKISRAAGSPLKYLENLWWNTQILSLMDLWNFTKEIVEFMKRKHGRRSKGRYGEMGSRLPWIIGTEFERVKQSAETEEVNKYKEAMEHWGIPRIQQTLHDTNSKDEAKACIMTLVHKGEMRWDDHEVWKTMNRLSSRYTTRGAQLYIPEPAKMPIGKSGEDMVLKVCDALWGEGTGAEWFGENTSKYNSQKNNFEFKFKQLENDAKGTNGPAGECKRLLAEWRKGEYVNGQEYEEMIDAAIKYGKMGAEDKMFFIIAGVLARKANNPHGETLLHYDRIGELNSKYLNQFPMLDFFTQERVFDRSIYDPSTGQMGKSRKLKLDDLELWKEIYFPDDFEKGEPDKQFSRFMWEVMMMSDATRTRISKGIRNAENIDHDDAHLIISATAPSEIDSLTTGPSGQKKYFTNEGYMNAYPGFNHFILSLSYALEEEQDDEKKQYKTDAMRDAINAFLRFDLILDNRLFKDKESQYARLDDRHYDRQTVVDKSTTKDGRKWVLRDHQKQLRNLIVEIGDAYGEDFHWLYDTPKTGSMHIKKELEEQHKYEAKVGALKETIAGLFGSDHGQKAMERIKKIRSQDEDSEKGLRGMKSSERPPPEVIERLHAEARRKQVEKITGAGHH